MSIYIDFLCFMCYNYKKRSFFMLKILEDKKEYIEMFRKTYVRWNNEHPTEPLDVMDKELISYFVRKAYTDMMPRTFRKLKPDSYIDPVARESVLCMLDTEILKWLKSDDKDYSAWHKNCVEKFVKDFNAEVLDKKYDPIAFGKGQKIVNMTMKYLSTCDNASDYEERFISCHVPVDSYILKWYYQNIPDAEKVNCWSSLTFEEYSVIQEKIRKYFEKSGKNPFAEEWEIWHKIRNS